MVTSMMISRVARAPGYILGESVHLNHPVLSIRCHVMTILGAGIDQAHIREVFLTAITFKNIHSISLYKLYGLTKLS